MTPASYGVLPAQSHVLKLWRSSATQQRRSHGTCETISCMTLYRWHEMKQHKASPTKTNAGVIAQDARSHGVIESQVSVTQDAQSHRVTASRYRRGRESESQRDKGIGGLGLSPLLCLIYLPLTDCFGQKGFSLGHRDWRV